MTRAVGVSRQWTSNICSYIARPLGIVARMGLYDNETDISIVFAAGRVIQMRPSERPYGLLSSLHAELLRRNLWVELMMSMTPDYARSLLLAVQMDKAAAAKQTRSSHAQNH